MAKGTPPVLLGLAPPVIPPRCVCELLVTGRPLGKAALAALGVEVSVLGEFEGAKASEAGFVYPPALKVHHFGINIPSGFESGPELGCGSRPAPRVGRKPIDLGLGQRDNAYYWCAARVGRGTRG